MIHLSNICRNVKPNLKLFKCIKEKKRQISLGETKKTNDNEHNNNLKDVSAKNMKNSRNREPKTSNGDTNKRKYPEEPTTCCMSGCANCVWLDYAEKLSEYYKDGGEKALKEINEKVTDPNIKAFLLHELRMRNQKPS